MADIQLIESRLAEARRQAATAQRELDERLLENNGAEDKETASLRAEVETHQSREAALIRVRKTAYDANSAATLEARHQESRNGVRAARGLERRYVNAAKALEAALDAVAIARSEFLQVDAELHAVIRAVCMNPELNDAQRSGLFVDGTRSWISDDAVRTYVRSMFDEVHRPESLAGVAAKHMQRTIVRLESAAAFQKPDRRPRSPYTIDGESELRSAAEAGEGV
ncbi:hypothetical protein WK24_13010 [Burkholderia vietnamiensis]|uniref:hypothetical protein n=1 Tax=Burkholderia vietnamiensis TaxID=60552 RepID=UPI00075AB313|nr:hypothetical protein [Burkholderia vietnamiensis]KVR68560.1 hypothetical protein WK24_13010 [Burkholderia vietnamiensis]